MIARDQLQKLMEENGKASYFKSSYTPGKRLKLLRQAVGLKGTEFAKSVHYAKSSVSQFENDKAVMSERFLEMVESTYGIDPGWLLYGGNEIITFKDNSYDPSQLNRSKEIRMQRMQGRISYYIQYLCCDDLEMVEHLCKRLFDYPAEEKPDEIDDFSDMEKG